MKKISDYLNWIKRNKIKNNIDSICKEYNITNYTINEDGTVDVEGNVNLYDMGLTKLPIKFGRVTGYFTCANNKLTSLEGSPDWVGSDFECNYNEIITLKGSPKYVGGNFNCAYNDLISLQGGPEIVIGYYSCPGNEIINFKGFPEDFDGDLSINGNPIFDKLKKISYNKRNKFIYWCNEFEAITDDGKVIPERMEEVYNKLGLEYEDYTPNTW